MPAAFYLPEPELNVDQAVAELNGQLATGDDVTDPHLDLHRRVTYTVDLHAAVSAVEHVAGTDLLRHAVTAYEPGCGDGRSCIRIAGVRFTDGAPDTLARRLDELAAHTIGSGLGVLRFLGGLILGAPTPGELHAALSRMAQACRDAGYTYTRIDRVLGDLRRELRELVGEEAVGRLTLTPCPWPQQHRPGLGAHSLMAHTRSSQAACEACLTQLLDNARRRAAAAGPDVVIAGT